MFSEVPAKEIPTTPAPGETLTCESCAAEFTCNAGQETCWCFDVKVSPDDLGVLKENYRQCLCPECLGNTGTASSF